MPSSVDQEGNDNDGAAPDFDPRFASSLCGSSVPLGQCLRQAVGSIISQQSDNDEDEDGDEYGHEDLEERKKKALRKRKTINLHPEGALSIIQSFGKSMADTQLDPAPCGAPRAILNARMDHYNRVGQNWRIVVDKVELQRRPDLLERRQAGKRKASLWKSETESTEIPLPRKQKVQILVFNDV
jgi:hypothetical protein